MTTGKQELKIINIHPPTYQPVEKVNLSLNEISWKFPPPDPFYQSFIPNQHGGWFLETVAERKMETKRGMGREKGMAALCLDLQVHTITCYSL